MQRESNASARLDYATWIVLSRVHILYLRQDKGSEKKEIDHYKMNRIRKHAFRPGIELSQLEISRL